MKWMGAGLLMLSACMAVYSERRQITAQIRCLDSLIAAFHTLARELPATGAPLRRLYEGLPPGPARSWLTDADGTVIAPLTAAQRSHLQEVRSVLGSYDGQTQARALLRAAGLLEQERDALAQTSPAALRSKQALVLSGAAVLTILLL